MEAVPTTRPSHSCNYYVISIFRCGCADVQPFLGSHFFSPSRSSCHVLGKVRQWYRQGLGLQPHTDSHVLIQPIPAGVEDYENGSGCKLVANNKFTLHRLSADDIGQKPRLQERLDNRPIDARMAGGY